MKINEYLDLFQDMQKDEQSLFKYLSDYLINKIHNKIVKPMFEGNDCIKILEEYSCEPKKSLIHKINISKLSRYCGLFNIYINIKLPELDLGDISWGWTKNVGFSIIKKCDLVINGKVLKSYSSRLIHHLFLLYTPSNCYQGLDRLIGNISSITELNTRHDKYNIYVPIQIFYNDIKILPLDDIKILPLDDINIELIIKYRPLYRCINHIGDAKIFQKRSELNEIESNLCVDYMYYRSKKVYYKYKQKFINNPYKEDYIYIKNNSDPIIDLYHVKSIYWYASPKKWKEGRKFILDHNHQNPYDYELATLKLLHIYGIRNGNMISYEFKNGSGISGRINNYGTIKIINTLTKDHCSTPIDDLGLPESDQWITIYDYLNNGLSLMGEGYIKYDLSIQHKNDHILDLASVNYTFLNTHNPYDYLILMKYNINMYFFSQPLEKLSSSLDTKINPISIVTNNNLEDKYNYYMYIRHSDISKLNNIKYI